MLLALLVLSLAMLAACGESEQLPQGAERVELDPADFTTEIDNPGEGGVQRVVVTVTDRKKRIANGIVARVVHDVVSEGGQPVEITDDWYAQDADGNVWYLGERTAEYEDGRVVSRAGSWEAGVDGAQPGIAMPADPRSGLAYRQEHYAGEAEDRARVLSIDERAEVPWGYFTSVALTKDVNPLEPRVLEYKLYAPGVGPVLVLDISGASGREELIKYRRGR